MTLDHAGPVNAETFPPQDPGAALAPSWGTGGGRGRLQRTTLISLQWRGLAGQFAVLGLASIWLGVEIPWLWCAPVVLAGVAVTLYLVWLNRTHRPQRDWENAAVLGFDTVQLAALVFLTGGVANPFAFLLVAPVTLTASTARAIHVLAIVGIGFLAIAIMAYWGWPLPSPLSESVELPPLYRAGVATALFSAIGFMANYAWRVSREAEQMEIALNFAQQVLAREQRLSALGALAAAAAHELGTPLATVQIVSKEIARSATTRELRDDAELLVQQAERCREILQRLTEAPEASDAMHDRLPLAQFLNEVIEPHLGGEVRIEGVLTGPPGAAPPVIRRMPELHHALVTLVENAADFAKAEVLVRARYDAQAITLEVQDDGPGFSADILSRLGNPYVTSRPQGEASRSGHIGMGLGCFISKTLLEKSGAVVSFENARSGGALVSARWARRDIEAPPQKDFSTIGG
jgi:two-component system sensor histidine kinase RegB